MFLICIDGYIVCKFCGRLSLCACLFVAWLPSLLHDFLICLCLWGALVSPCFRITSLGRLFLIDCLSCLVVIPNCFPSTKLGVWSRV